MQKIVAKIYLGNVRKNAETFKGLCGGKLCAVVKADAYGHGAEEVARSLSGVADLFAVALIEEGIALRSAACDKDILVFTPPVTEEEGYATLVGGFIASVPNLYVAELLSRLCLRYRLRARVHLKINTGMNRYGVELSQIEGLCRYLSARPWISVEGAYSHLYQCSERTAAKQKTLFLRAREICKRYFPNGIYHLSATYGATLGKEYAFDMIRVGVGLYGYTPTASDLSLKKGMSVETKVVDTRRYRFGGAGYGRLEYPLKAGEPLYACRVGYADGFLRNRENGLLGREKGVNDLCMDVRICRGEKEIGEVIPLLTDADEVAKQTGTISYEVLCAIGRRAQRIYEDE